MTSESRRLLLCSDMDGTVIPYAAPEDADARPRLRALCRHPAVALAYVTGRDAELVREAIAQFDLPTPAYAVTDVGACIWRVDAAGDWTRWDEWQTEIAQDWRGQTQEQARPLLADWAGLTLQAEERQQPYKLSYYWDMDQCAPDDVLTEVQTRLQPLGWNTELTLSIDAHQRVGLLDVLPRRATKRHAVEFLQAQLNYTPDQVVFAGDSGNDLSVMESHVHSVLVANPPPEVKAEGRRLAADTGQADTLYIATGGVGYGNGNYAAGVLEGVAHFCPRWADDLRQTTASA